MAETKTPSAIFAKLIAKQIRQNGPISVAHYMTLCLLDPRYGYYPTRDPIGAGADFITAPEISQIFGELIGIWLANCWQMLGSPDKIHLVEPGPGKGTMMSDVLRTSRSIPEFYKALNVHLFEASAALVAVQAKTLGNYPQPINWTDNLGNTGSGPLLLIANEYVDCLPIRQFIRRQEHWFERMVDLNQNDEFIFVTGTTPLANIDIELIAPKLREAKDGTLVEVRNGLDGLLEPLFERAKTDPVIALFIDYGPAISETGDSFQAVSKHKKVNPLQNPGQVDLTARVDFSELARTAKRAGLKHSKIYNQGQWLQQMGLFERAAALSSAKTADRAKIARQVHRLSDENEMGNLFKVMAVYSDGLPEPAGFDV